jgi:hypothetical protein
VSVTAVKHQICRYFGGEYDENARAYLTPAVPGLGAVRRARGKRSNKNELHSGMGTDTHGSTMLVHVQSGQERRVTLGGPACALRKVAHEVVLHVFLHSTARAAEDAQDAFDELRDGLFEHLRADPTLGSGGFERRLPDGSGGFQVAEGDNPWLAWEMDPVETSGTVTRGYLVISFDADQYLYA